MRRCVVTLGSIALAVGLSPAPARAQATPEAKAAAIVEPAVVYIEQAWQAWVRVPGTSQLFFKGWVNDGQPFTWTTRCTGFIVNPTGYVVTAGHCVDPGEEGARGRALQFAAQWLINDGWAFPEDFGFLVNEGHLIWKVEGSEAGSPPDLSVFVQRGVAAGGLRTGEAFGARIIDYAPLSDGDVALLKIEEFDLPSLLLAPPGEIEIGTPVLSVGYPGSSDEVTDATYEPTFKDGQINSKKTREGGTLPVYEMSAALSGGMSGGPTVNLDGEVIGVNSFSIVGETEAFNFLTPSSLVTEMLARNGVANELGPVDQAYRAGVDAFFAGDYRTAIEKLDEALALNPKHQQAQELRVEAVKLRGEQPAPEAVETTEAAGGAAVGIIIGVVGAIVVLGGLGTALALRRRGGPPPPVAAPGAAREPVAVGASTSEAPVGFQPTTPPPTAAPERAGDLTGTGEPPGQAAAPAEPAAPGAPLAPVARTAGGSGAEGGRRFCSNCGSRVGPGSRFCESCGHPLG